MTLPVLAAEKAEVESVKISAPHTITGIHSPSGASSGASVDKVFVAGIYLTAVFTSIATSGRHEASRYGRFFMKPGNVSHLSIIDGSY
jgi:hypothetical protein